MIQTRPLLRTGAQGIKFLELGGTHSNSSTWQGAGPGQYCDPAHLSAGEPKCLEEGLGEGEGGADRSAGHQEKLPALEDRGLRSGLRSRLGSGPAGTGSASAVVSSNQLTVPFHPSWAPDSQLDLSAETHPVLVRLKFRPVSGNDSL